MTDWETDCGPDVVVERSVTICELCGLELQIGFYPFCHGDPTKHVRQAASVNGDECDLTIENLGHDPLHFTSKQAIAVEADHRGLRIRDQWAGPSDKHLTNWAASIDAQTLDNARVLLTRVRAVRDADSARLQSLQTSVEKWNQA